MKSFFLSLIAFGLVVLISCSSPTDLHTPRNKFFEDTTTTRIKALSVHLKILKPSNFVGGDTIEYDSQWQKAEIDISHGLTLWIQGTCDRPPAPKWPADDIPLSLTRLILRMDSLIVGPTSVYVRDDQSAGQGTRVVMASIDGLSDFTYAPTDDFQNNVTMTFTHDTGQRKITAEVSFTEYSSEMAREITINGIFLITY